MDLTLSRLRLSLPQFCRWGSLAAAALVTSLCGLLLLRRAGGALTQPLGPAAFVLLTAVAVTCSATFRLIWLASRNRGRAQTLFSLGLPTLCLLFLAIAVSVPTTSRWILIAFWCVLLVTEATWWTIGTRRVEAWQAGRRQLAEVRSASTAHPETPSDEGPVLPELVTQQLTRSGDEAGGESIVGFVRAKFAAGESHQHIHVAFCPPFAQRPQLQAYILDGPQAMLKVAQLESFGTRLELRLASPIQQPQEIVVGFDASVSRDPQLAG